MAKVLGSDSFKFVRRGYLGITKRARHDGTVARIHRNGKTYQGATLGKKMWLEAKAGQREPSSIGDSLTYAAAIEEYARRFNCSTAIAISKDKKTKEAEFAVAYLKDDKVVVADPHNDIKNIAKERITGKRSHAKRNYEVPVERFESKKNQEGKIVAYLPASAFVNSSKKGSILDLPVVPLQKLKKILQSQPLSFENFIDDQKSKAQLDTLLNSLFSGKEAQEEMVLEKTR